MVINTEEDFWELVDKTETCWLWKGPKNNRKAPTFSINKKRHQAHRLAWQLTKGIIPEGMSLISDCKNKLCVNPNHYYLSNGYTKYDNKLLSAIAKSSKNIAEVLIALGLKQAGGNYCHIKRCFKKFNIDTSHFTGYGSNKGKKLKTRLHYSEILIKKNNGRRENAHKLRRALVEAGELYKCSECGNTGIWNGKPLTLQVDHINGDWLDHTKENLRFLCPNCHSQTSTYGAKRRD